MARLQVKLLTSTAKDLLNDDQSVRIQAMRWSMSSSCKEACAEVGISHSDYLQAIQYIHKNGPERGSVAAKQLSYRLTVG